MTTLTNAELAAAIEWVYGKLEAAHRSSKLNYAENSFMYTHLSELLRIQRERAAQVGAPTRIVMGVTQWYYRAAYDNEPKWHVVAP